MSKEEIKAIEDQVSKPKQAGDEKKEQDTEKWELKEEDEISGGTEQTSAKEVVALAKNAIWPKIPKKMAHLVG